MAILPIIFDEGDKVKLQVSATTFTKGDMCVFSSGYMAKAAAGQGAPVFYVILETVSSTATQGDEHTFVRTVRNPIFEALTDGTPTQAQMGTYMDVAGSGSIDEDASLDDLFFAERIINASDKKIQGCFKGYTVES